MKAKIRPAITIGLMLSLLNSNFMFSASGFGLEKNSGNGGNSNSGMLSMFIRV